MKRVALVFVLFLFCCTTATSPPADGMIGGVVAEPNGIPLPGVTVILHTPRGDLTTVTDAQGHYEFRGVPAGTHRIEAQLWGFNTASTMVNVQSGSGTIARLTLRAAAVAEMITVTAAAPTPVVTRSASCAFIVSGLNLGNRASYAPIKENEFVDAPRQPVTTFSIDVDGASYANVRRFLRENLPPPPDSVRIEEMVNYFVYRYPPPADGTPVAIATELAGCPWAPEHRLLRIGLQAKSVEQWRLAPNNLVFLLDVSGSMSPPDRLPLVQSAIHLLVEHLAPTDTVAIVVYAGAAGLALPPTPASQKDVIFAALDNLEAGGSTAGGEGIELAYKTAAEHFDGKANNRVILATDGDFNVGISDEKGLTKLIEEKRKSGIYLTCIGVGDDNLQDSLIETLADKGNGNYYYLDSMEEAKKVFGAQLTGTLVAVADDVKVQVEFNPQLVASYRQIGYENRALANSDFTDDAKDAGELGSGQSVTALYEIVPSRGAGGRMATVRLRYKEPGGKNSKEIAAAAYDERKSAFEASPDTQFAAAVAEFGMLLRNSRHKGRASYADVAALARAMRGEDMEGYREELIRMVEASRVIMEEQRVAKK